MTAHKKKHQTSAAAPRARSGRSRQRQRLIDACIAALHIHGPSRTTVEKVVAIAKMSPGIVRFYFDSKGAMLVASLKFLAAEFEERVLAPVAARKSNPVAALELLVDLYLDPGLASPRKVSVWYAFWGEASSRQEYYDICGQKDSSSAALVRELIETLIVESAQPHLDADGIALGLIGVLEILWQDIAFQTERDIDRPAARRRAMAYLRSIFPGRFASVPLRNSKQAAAAVPSSIKLDPRVSQLERDALLQGAWTIVGHESQIPQAGDCLARDIAGERILVVRGGSGSVYGLRQEVGHASAGRASAGHASAGRADLETVEMLSADGLLFVRRP